MWVETWNLKKNGMFLSLALREIKERLPGITNTLREKETFFMGSLKFEVLFVPGHTLGHIAFLNRKHQLLFSGDTVCLLWVVGGFLKDSFQTDV